MGLRARGAPALTRKRLVDASRPFDLTWFIPSIVRFRGLLGEALVGSLFLQLFAPNTPLFTQIVIDRVPVHKGWPSSTCWYSAWS